jgi:peptide/nickel transport system substrate-binding protein
MGGTKPTKGLRLRRLWPLPAVAVALATAVGVHAAPAPRTVTVGTLVAESSFDPFKNENGYFLQYLQPLYDTLIRRTSRGSYTPDLAMRWGYAPGSKNTAFSLTLRRGLKFADGTPFDANAVKANVEFAKSAGGPRADQLASVASVSTPNAWTVSLRLSRSDPSLPLTLSQVNGMMVSPKALLDPVALDQTPAGIGPYALDRLHTVNGDHYTYVRNGRYWNAKAFAFDKIVIRVLPSARAAFDAIRAGRVDLAPGVPADLAAGRKARLAALMWTANCLGLWLWDRAGKLDPPLAKLAVRRALNYAVDRRAIFKSLYADEGTPGTQIFVPGSNGYRKSLDSRYAYSPSKARKLLAQAGYPKGFVLPVLSVPVADPQLAAIARYLKTVGVQVQIHDVPPASLPNEIARPRFPALMFSYSWQDAFQDSQAMVLPGGFFNPFGSSDRVVTSLWQQAAQTSDHASARRLFQAESARIVDLAWFLVIGYDKTVYWVNPRRVGGVHATPAQPVPSIFGWTPR